MMKVERSLNSYSQKSTFKWLLFHKEYDSKIEQNKLKIRDSITRFKVRDDSNQRFSYLIAFSSSYTHLDRKCCIPRNKAQEHRGLDLTPQSYCKCRGNWWHRLIVKDRARKEDGGSHGFKRGNKTALPRKLECTVCRVSLSRWESFSDPEDPQNGLRWPIVP